MDHPTATEYSALIQRFKLLNLVQQVARRDVADLIETVGLEALVRRGTLAKWKWGDFDDLDGEERSTSRVARRGGQLRDAVLDNRYSPSVTFSAPSRRATRRLPGPASSSTPPMRFAAASSAVGTSGHPSHRGGGPTRSPQPYQRVRRVIRRTESEEEDFFSRLAEPRARPAASVEEVVEVRRGGPPPSRPSGTRHSPSIGEMKPVEDWQPTATPSQHLASRKQQWAGDAGGGTTFGYQGQTPPPQRQAAHVAGDASYPTPPPLPPSFQERERLVSFKMLDNNEEPKTAATISEEPSATSPLIHMAATTLTSPPNLDLNPSQVSSVISRNKLPDGHSFHLALPQPTGEGPPPSSPFTTVPQSAVTMAASTASPHTTGGASFPKSPRIGRGPAPKAKPKGASSVPQVPIESVRQAAALLSASIGAGSSTNSHLAKSSSFGGASTTRPLASQTVNAPRSKGLGLRGRGSGTTAGHEEDRWDFGLNQSLLPRSGPTATGGVENASLQELSTAIDRMLKDHQTLLSGLYKGDPSLEGDGLTTSAAPASSKLVMGGSATGEGGSGDNGSVGIEELAQDASGDDESAEDEMLLYAKLQHQLTQMDADMASMDAAFPFEGGLSGNTVAPISTPKEVGQGSRTATAGEAKSDGPGPRLPRRRRGEMPDVVVQRLCTYRMEAFQYIAYHERLWNTSNVTQFAFAQRLTAAMIEECWDEVMAEVENIMDDYVDGLASHELQ